jgi:hypothetical protein
MGPRSPTFADPSDGRCDDDDDGDDDDDDDDGTNEGGMGGGRMWTRLRARSGIIAAAASRRAASPPLGCFAGRRAALMALGLLLPVWLLCWPEGCFALGADSLAGWLAGSPSAVSIDTVAFFFFLFFFGL